MPSIRRIMDRFELILGTFAALALGTIMVAMCADTFMRYMFNAPI
ncbi:MAG: hypothetical protein ACOH2H_25705 [Cypionkella sp.]